MADRIVGTVAHFVGAVGATVFAAIFATDVIGFAGFGGAICLTVGLSIGTAILLADMIDGIVGVVTGECAGREGEGAERREGEPGELCGLQHGGSPE
jgi:hypothetical protein